MGSVVNFARHLGAAANEVATEKQYAYHPLKPQHLAPNLAAHAQELQLTPLDP